MEPITVAFFGISGSGKGTQANLLIEYLAKKDPSRATVRAEMGNFLRQYWEEDTKISRRVKEIMLNGGLVPSFVAVYMLARYFDTKVEGNEHFIFDGTCRKNEQSVAVDEISRFYGRDDLHVITLNLSKDAARQRLIARGRSDDVTEEALATRFQWYKEQVIPAMEKLRELGWHIHEIDGEADVDTIHKNILAALGLAGG